MAKEIKQMTDLCEICKESKPKNPREPLIQHSDGQSPWTKIGMNLFEIKGNPYLVVIDYFSNFTEVDYLSKTTSSQVITILKKQFARFGIPTTIVSDNGPQFSSDEFRQFTTKWGINHMVSSPNHPQENGKVESHRCHHVICGYNRTGRFINTRIASGRITTSTCYHDVYCRQRNI
ncbi:Hypothetical predicted protein [Mytilus galloprovincialis]|uniref:Integrase catalytic domain-containing protein n=1 Tax=Mytilus galloprovincialis TaxID=29158 RepID=A0A8B6DPX4_MYTGA|nr:Hypothetical predicted protein [Mytilus galloprovincialis]